jgi:hypothetical protein
MYAYVRNNPLALTDPDGRDAIAVGFKTLAANAGHAALIRFTEMAHPHSVVTDREEA